MPRNPSAEHQGNVVYIVRCADGSYYTGRSAISAEKRVTEHNLGIYEGYTRSRRPVTLMFAEHFDRITEAIAFERQVKGWARAKKEALMRRDWDELVRLARSKQPNKS